jgi:DNA polymerase-3 subunit gamma/tau
VVQTQPPKAPTAPPSQVSSPAEVPANPKIQFEPEAADALWTQIAARFDVRDFLGISLTKVSRTAISGPNQLEVFFPPAYHGNKSHCEQPAPLGRLEKVASEVTGQPVKVVCRRDAEADAGEPKAHAVREPKAGENDNKTTKAAANPKAAANAENGRQDPAAVNDPYVERARAIFDAKIENVTVANSRARQATDDAESAADS